MSVPLRAFRRRIDALERRRVTPRRGILVCDCATRNGYVTPDEHLPGCLALSATDDDTVIIIRYADDVVA